MPVAIVEVMNNTSSGILHYTNQESGYTFDVNPTIGNYRHGYISTSKYKDDTVPYKSSGRKIIITVDGGGPQFSICDDNYKFSVIGNGKPEQWTASFNNGDQFVMMVDSDDVKFVRYNVGLKTNDAGYVMVGGVPAVAAAFANPVFAVKF